MGDIDPTSGGAPESGVREPHLFLALDGNYPARPTSRHRLGAVAEVLFGRGRERSIEREALPGGADTERLVLRFPDPWMSSSHATIRRVGREWVLEDRDSKNGSFVNGSPEIDTPLVDGDVVQCGHTFFVFRDSAPVEPGEPADYVADLDVPPALSSLLVPLSRSLARIASAEGIAPTLIVGEHGTGKDHLARALHDARGRTGQLVTAVASEVQAEALFRPGREPCPGELYDSARGGTLVLDDAGSLSMHAQYALVRALDHDKALPPEQSVFVIASSSRDLGHLVKRRMFRPDLERMLATNAMVLPPLRQRREDIGLLIATGLRNAADDARSLSFSSESGRALLAYVWPHNISELAACLHEAAEKTARSVIDLEHLPPELQRASFDADSSGDTLDTIDLSDRARRQRELAAMLHAAGRVMILDKTRDD